MMERSRPDRSAVDSALCAWQGESSALREIIDKWLIVWRSGGSVSAQAQVVVHARRFVTPPDTGVGGPDEGAQKEDLGQRAHVPRLNLTLETAHKRVSLESSQNHLPRTTAGASWSLATFRQQIFVRPLAGPSITRRHEL
jgi:hypothetical protein